MPKLYFILQSKINTKPFKSDTPNKRKMVWRPAQNAVQIHYIWFQGTPQKKMVQGAPP